MSQSSDIARSLFPLAISSAVGALSLGAESLHPTMAAAKIVGDLVFGLAVNYASAWIPPLLGSLRSSDWSASNFDLDRVAKHALLTILYESLSDHGISRRETEKAVRKAADAWDLRIFSDPVPDQSELIDFLGTPRPLPPGRAQALARSVLGSDHAALHPDYGAAIADRFARTFEILLRGDERAFRAATIYLQRLSLRDTESLRADVARVLKALAKPQPALERFEVLEKKHLAPEITDLQFKRRATAFLFRKPDEARIWQWLQSPDPFRILKITGPAGMGKSRLALHICDWCDREHWLAGFLGKDPWPAHWTPLRDTLVVLDYAASKSVSGRSAFEWLESIFLRTKEPHAPRVRIILIDRTEQGPLWLAWRNSECEKDLEALTLHVPLAPDRAEFDAIVQSELIRRLGARPSPQHLEAIASLAPRLRGQFRPLFGMLAAAAVAEGSQSQRWSPELLIESVLKMQLRQWHTAGISDQDLDLLFEATLTQGECNVDSEFARQVETLTPEKLASLASLSAEGFTLGPIVPDLLGEFFLLMRLRGDATMETRLEPKNTKIARALLDKSWRRNSAAAYIGLLLEDFLSWTPQTRANPAREIAGQALAALESLPDSSGLLDCCFSIAWKLPGQRDWAAWLRQLPDSVATGAAIPLSIGLYNATVVEPDPAQRMALAERIEALHREYGQEPAVREQLAKALYNATVVEPDPPKRLALAERIEALHREYGQEPAVREPLATALFSATVGEPDPAQRLALAERIEALHREYGQEPAVREQLAKALSNATVVEPDPAQRLALAERIEALHRQYGQEPAVREPLATALFSATVGEPDPAQRLALAERIEALHREYGQEPAVREQLAKALSNATVVEPDPAQRLALAERIEALHRQYGQEPAVREPLATAFFNATAVEPDPAKCLALAERIEALHREYGQEPAVRDLLAKALYNETVGEPSPAKRLALAERIEALHREYRHEPAVRERLAKALHNATVVEPDPAQCLALAERIEALHREYGQEPAVRELLAEALSNATVVEPDPARCLALADRIEALHREYRQEPAVREQLAKALYNATVVEPDPAQRLALAERIEALHREYGQEPAVREPLAKALSNATFVEPDPARRKRLVDRLTRLSLQFPNEPILQEALRRAKT